MSYEGRSLLTLGITATACEDMDQYVRWISRASPNAELVTLSKPTGNEREIRRCDGLILTGGGDIHPKFYGREDALNLVRGVDIDRDEFEFEIVREARDLQIPVLGICRGLQLFNVANGGTLIPDVVRAGFKNHRKGKDGSDRLHSVAVEAGSILRTIVQVDEGEVNSSHHQSVGKIGRQLRPGARSEDGLIESLECEGGSHQWPFVLLVQWHPERMREPESPFSRGLLERFLHEAEVKGKERGSIRLLKTRNIQQ